MNKSAIKSFAISARRKLVEQVKQKAFEIGITNEKVTELLEIDGHVLLNGIPQKGAFKDQRTELIEKINSRLTITGKYKEAYEQVMEEVACLWFIRFIALRFMEVNGYLPTDLNLDKNKIYEFQDKNNSEGLYKSLIINQCNALYEILPFMFEKIADYTELLFPSDFFMDESVVHEDEWKEVEIVGWLYQYYISEKKDEVFLGLKQNKKITKENIAAATQLFTPKWIAQYMVENSLGRLWLESYSSEELKTKWKYYLEEAKQEPEVQKQLDEFKNPNLDPRDIKILDPCCGSGHILVYAFDVLYDIYKCHGYLQEEIPRIILENNLHGLDIDERAVQLASFALMMKARSKSNNIFSYKPKLNVFSIYESNSIPQEAIEYLVNGNVEIAYLIEVFHDAKEFGSILEVKEVDYDALEIRVSIDGSQYKGIILEKVLPLIQQARRMNQKFDIVVTNPPYMGKRQGMNGKLAGYLEQNYKESKNDLCTVFIEKCLDLIKANGYVAMITQQGWMFLDCFEEMRKTIIDKRRIVSMVHLGKGAFGEISGEVVQTTSFIFGYNYIANYKGTYFRLVEEPKGLKKEELYLNKRNQFIGVKQDVFKDVLGCPIAYWISDRVRNIFKYSTPFGNYAEAKAGLSTGKNDLFIRFWYEVAYNKIGLNYTSCEEAQEGKHKWFPCNNGGDYRKWYGNNEIVIDWEKNGLRLKSFRNHKGELLSAIRNTKYYFQEGLTWTKRSPGRFAVRLKETGFIFEDAGRAIFSSCSYMNKYYLGLLSSKITLNFLKILNPTMNFTNGDIKRIPTKLKKTQSDKKLLELIENSIYISKKDWDSYETSWNFEKHPLLTHRGLDLTIKEAFGNWSNFADSQFNRLKQNEEKLNSIFINIYDLQEDLTPEVEDSDITIRKANRKKDIKSFISYGVGCMLGRYSLGEDGLAFAGGDFDINRYKICKPNENGLLTILDAEYLNDDIVSGFVEFLKAAFSKDTLSENLDFIAETLGRKSSEASRDTIRRYFIKDFYKDHLQVYKNRPIYWMLTSGKSKVFKALIYMHMYQSTTLSTVIAYLHELSSKLEMEKISIKDVKSAQKKLQNLDLKILELREYMEVIRHVGDQNIEFDLDNGVKVNYAKFEGLLEKIKL